MNDNTKDMELKNRICDEAMKMFLKYGVKSVRMDDIASYMNISKRTLYELFGDRENLIIQTIEKYQESRNAEGEKIDKKAKNVMELFILLLSDWENLMKQNIIFMNDLRRFYPSIHERIFANGYDKGTDKLKQALGQGVKDGVFIPDLNIEFSAQMLTGSIINVFMHPTPYQANNISQWEAFKYILMCFIRGISTSKGLRLLDQFIATSYDTKIKKENPV